MKQRGINWGLIVLVVIISGMLVMAGCAQKKVLVQEEPGMTAGTGVAAGSDEETVITGESGLREEALTEEELKEQALREAELKEKMLAEKEIPSFEDIYFGFDKYDLTPESRSILSNIADWLMEHPDFELIVEGHCDERGTTEYNLALGERRADSAKKYIMPLGVSGVTTISYGEEIPVDPRQCEEAWTKNRRGHLVIVPKKK